jgi:hypothetical protein
MKVGFEAPQEEYNKNTYNTGDSLVVTDPTADVRRSKAYLFREKGSKNRWSRDAKTGASFPLLVSALRFKKTEKLAVPQNRKAWLQDLREVCIQRLTGLGCLARHRMCKRHTSATLLP